MKSYCIIIYIVSLMLGILNSHAEQTQSKNFQLPLFESHTLEVPQGWKRVNDSEGYQIESSDGEVVVTATKYEAPKDGWEKFWKTLLRPDFTSLKWTGKTEMLGHKDH